MPEDLPAGPEFDWQWALIRPAHGYHPDHDQETAQKSRKKRFRVRPIATDQINPELLAAFRARGCNAQFFYEGHLGDFTTFWNTIGGWIICEHELLTD